MLFVFGEIMKALGFDNSTFDLMTLIYQTDDYRVSRDSYLKMKKVLRRYRDLNNIKGKLGELYVYDNIINTLRQMGYRFSYKREPMTFYTKKQYRINGKGIDIYIRMVNQNNFVYRLMIEVSNWKKMRNINNYIYTKRILNKFKRWDKDWNCYHILAINRRNVKLLKARCRRDGILILELPEHVTPDFLLRLAERGEFTERNT
jgi:hypothetical protein